MTKAKEGKGKIGSRFDGFLRGEGLYAEAQAVAIKRVLAWQLTEAMKKQLTKSAPGQAARPTSRSRKRRCATGHAYPRGVGCELRATDAV